MGNHSKGPWLFEGHGGYGRTIAGETMPFGYISTGPGDPFFVLDHPGFGGVGPRVMLANAQLMATAPELVDALELVVGSLRCDRQDDVNAEVLRRVERAIAKSRGEA